MLAMLVMLPVVCRGKIARRDEQLHRLCWRCGCPPTINADDEVVAEDVNFGWVAGSEANDIV